MSEVVEGTYGKITDEAVADVRRRLNKVYPIDEPFVRHVNSDSIRHAARAIGESAASLETSSYLAIRSRARARRNRR